MDEDRVLLNGATTPPRRLISIVVPVYQEAENIVHFLRDLEAQVREPHEVLLVYDFPEDNTLPAVRAMQPLVAAIRLVHNTLCKGVLNAIRAGFLASHGDVIVWPLKALCDYVEATGDLAVLEAQAPWRDDKNAATATRSSAVNSLLEEMKSQMPSAKKQPCVNRNAAQGTLNIRITR